jgi:microcystin-dependent protein
MSIIAPNPATTDWVPLSGPQGPQGIQGPTGPTGPTGPAGGVPAGIGGIWFSNTPPTGWAILDGSTIINAQTLNPELWANVDPTWKSGANIILPDLRGRVPVGKGTHTDVDAFTDNDGAAVASRSVKHRHTVTDPGHVHPGTFIAPGTGLFINDSISNIRGPNSGVSSAVTGITVGPTGLTLDAPGFQVVNWIIKL